MSLDRPQTTSTTDRVRSVNSPGQNARRRICAGNQLSKMITYGRCRLRSFWTSMRRGRRCGPPLLDVRRIWLSEDAGSP